MINYCFLKILHVSSYNFITLFKILLKFIDFFHKNQIIIFTNLLPYLQYISINLFHSIFLLLHLLTAIHIDQYPQTIYILFYFNLIIAN